MLLDTGTLDRLRPSTWMQIPCEYKAIEGVICTISDVHHFGLFRFDFYDLYYILGFSALRFDDEVMAVFLHTEPPRIVSNYDEFKVITYSLSSLPRILTRFPSSHSSFLPRFPLPSLLPFLASVIVVDIVVTETPYSSHKNDSYSKIQPR